MQRRIRGWPRSTRIWRASSRFGRHEPPNSAAVATGFTPPPLVPRGRTGTILPSSTPEVPERNSAPSAPSGGWNVDAQARVRLQPPSFDRPRRRPRRSAPSQPPCLFCVPIPGCPSVGNLPICGSLSAHHAAYRPVRGDGSLHYQLMVAYPIGQIYFIPLRCQPQPYCDSHAAACRATKCRVVARAAPFEELSWLICRTHPTKAADFQWTMSAGAAH